MRSDLQLWLLSVSSALANGCLFSGHAGQQNRVDIQRRSFQNGSEEVYVSLADHLEPESTEGQIARSQSWLLETWAQHDDIARDKKFKLGSEATVFAGADKGLFSTVLAAYNNHWVVRTRPEDWWTSVSQTIATRIDKVATQPAVRKFFVSHEGKKQLTVDIGPSIQGINNEWFFQEMISQITDNINKPEYTSLMQSDFSQSTSVDRIVNNIMLMYSFQEYFEYRVSLTCGIPGVVMEGSEEDWQNLVEKLAKVEQFLQPLDEVLQLGDWFRTSTAVLSNLLETRRGNPDRDWWSRIMDIDKRFGSGQPANGGTYLSGWFVTDFLGLSHYSNLREVPSGLNVVPLTILSGAGEEQSALVAGVTGFTIIREEVRDSRSNRTFPSVRSVLGWGLLLDSNSTLY